VTKIHLAQLIVERDPARNCENIMRVLANVQPDDWVVFPEACLSGYFPEDPDFITRLNPDEIEIALNAIHDVVRDRGCHCLLGTAWRSSAGWQNAAFLLSPHGGADFYAKIQLSALDVQHFCPGPILPVFRIDGMRLGIQLCREVLFPQQWSVLRQAGAQIVVHLNNALNPHDAIWEHVLITRALENAMYVCSVNNAAPPQQLTSYLIAPNGHVMLKVERQTEQVLSATIDLAEVVQNITERTDF
jgi:predicted amidohydrolase